MSSVTSRAILGLLAGSALSGAAYADRPQLGAFIDVQQVGEMQLHGQGSDDVTYTEVSGTVNGQINNRRIVGSLSYRLGYRFPESGKTSKDLDQNGVARVQANVVDDWLTLDAGAISTRSRINPTGAAPLFNSANPTNITQTYSIFAQPTLTHRFGDLGVSALYRYAYTTNQSGDTGPVSGLPTDRFDSSTEHEGMLSFGMTNSALPFDWSVSNNYRHENSTNLARHLRSYSSIGEIKLPVAATIALVTSAGYEQTQTSQRKALVDANGVPVLGKGGRFVADLTSPRTLTYDVNGFVGDAGIIWKPSRRTRMEARVGYRYGGLSVTGLVEMHPSDRSGLTIQLTDSIQSFGQDISSSLASSPAQLDLGQSADPSTTYQNCLFGKKPGSGSCIGGALGGASASAYRERALNIIFTRQMRRWAANASFGYSHRRYIDDPTLAFSLDGIVDQSFFGDLTLSGQLTRTSGISFSFSGNYFKNGQVGAGDVLSGAFSSGYYRTFGRGIRAQASLSVEASKQDGDAADVSGRAQLGVQYQF